MVNGHRRRLSLRDLPHRCRHTTRRWRIAAPPASPPLNRPAARPRMGFVPFQLNPRRRHGAGSSKRERPPKAHLGQPRSRLTRHTGRKDTQSRGKAYSPRGRPPGRRVAFRFVPPRQVPKQNRSMKELKRRMSSSGSPCLPSCPYLFGPETANRHRTDVSVSHWDNVLLFPVLKN